MRRAAPAGLVALAWVVVGSGLSGLATYVLLVVVARAVGPVAYGDFSVFWTFVVVVSLGGFLPVEQLTARTVGRRLAVGLSPGSALRDGVRSGSLVAGVVLAAGVVLLVAQPGVPDPRLVVLVPVVVAGFVVQFAARGVLAGVRDLRGYAAVLVTDAGVRAVVAAVLWAGGVTSVLPYMVGVTASCVACALVGLVLARRARPPADGPAAAPDDVAAPGTDDRITTRALVPLVVAASCMQLLLNSGVLVARAVPDAEAALAGVILAVLTLVRLPVFVFQAAQAGYVSRVAALHRTRDGAGLRRLVALIGGVVAVVAGVTLVTAATIGPQLVRWVFGAGYDVERGAVVLVAVGVAGYLAASVLNDLAVALGAHRAVVVAWPAAVVVAAGSLLLARGSATWACTLPLAVGAATAALVLGPVVASRVRSVLSLPPGPGGPKEVDERA
ncbi:hypothetical protein KQI48_15245 [Cellulomonas hominis]|uniref:hypothetical protein n=1 Tax=Cellulomonas hominis TaxID=156981 RepID=UPI001C123E6A|nr:hypothetical protein [Cellulomonas hominis]MBU5424023.1 hypothetical protein [Cellulomonas hominis]